MSHMPVNHPLRPLYRVITALTAAWLLVFGAIGLLQTQSEQWFARGDWHALGVPTNRAFAALSLVAGAVVLLGAVIGRNVDRFINFWGGGGFLLAGTAMLALLDTEANVLNFSVVTASVSYVIGLLLLASALYGKVGTAEQAAAEEAFRTGTTA